MLPKIVPTNIPGLDQMLGGGFTPGSVVLIESARIPETELIGLQIAAEAAAHGEQFFFMTIEFSPEELKRKARKYGWTYGKAEQEKNLYWIDCHSRNAKKQTGDDPSVILVDSPLDLPSISSSIAKIESTFYKRADYHKALFVSVNELVKYNSIESTERFLVYLASVVKRADAIAFFFTYNDKELEGIVGRLRKTADAKLKIFEKEGKVFIEVVDLPFLAFLGRNFGEITKNLGELTFGKAEGPLPRYTFVVR